MTLKFRSLSTVALVVCAIFLLNSPASRAAAKSKRSSAKAAASKSASKGRRGREEASSRKSKRERTADSRRDRRDSKAERGGRRSRAEEREAARVSRKDPRRMSKRERMIAARIEAERRRREAAERARQIALAIARQRAADQALKDEAHANILKDDTTGEDMEVRSAAIRALGDRAGTVVVMNPKTGQVYTVVNQEWGLRRGFKPCSTTKLVTGLAGLTENVIDPVQTANISTASYRLDLTDSLAFSDNGYFQRVGGQVGFSKMMEYAHKLGLGEPTGINFPAESPGRLPSFKEGYAVNHMSSHGDDIEVTAIQLANLASAIGNGGHLLVPHMPRTPEEGVHFKRIVKRDINIPETSIQHLIPGMIGSVNYGSGRLAYNPTETIAGKTGTCTGQGAKLGLFTSFAPVHDPELAIAVITRGSGSKGKYSAAVAGQIYASLRQRFGPRPGSQPALANDMLAPRPHVDPRKAGIESDEDEGDADAAAGDATVVSEAGQGSAQAGTQNGNAQPSLQKTSRTVERPAANTPSRTATPVPSSSPGLKSNATVERPRRVSDKP
jgi:penicillin-binding protein 2